MTSHDLPDPVKIKVGMPSDPKEITVEVPATEPIPWQLGEEHALVGKRTPRMDAVLKVTGKAKYTHDINLPGMLYAVLVRSPHARATVKSVDVTAAKAYPGVKIAREAGSKEVRYAWQHVAVVAAATRQAATEAARLVKVEYEVKPHAARMEQALADGAPAVLRNGPNKRSASREETPPERKKEVDDLLKSLGEDPKGSVGRVVSATATTQVQTHSALETHGLVAQWEGDSKLKVWASTQGTFSVRGELAGHFKLKESDVTVIAHFMGGGFGAKFGADYFGILAAELAKEAGAPVKLMLDRKGEHTSVGNRPNSVQEMTVGVKADGTIAAYRLNLMGTGGIAGGAGAANPLIYNFGVVDRSAYEVATNAGPAAAFRAPGHPQGSFGVETIIDLAAEAIGMDPLEFRMKNDPFPIRQLQYKEGAKLIGWDKRQKNGSGSGPIRRGLGVAAARWFQLGGRGARVLCRIHKDGSVEVRNGCQDIGTGTRTIMAMVTAEELGVPLAAVTPFIGDTNDPVGPASGGSTTAPTLMPAVRTAAYLVGIELKKVVAEQWKCKPEEIALAGGKVQHKTDASKSVAWKDACAMIPGDDLSAQGERSRNFATYKDSIGGVQFAEVEVDVETGQIRVTRFVAMQDCGTVVNPLLAESQVNGAVIQGISYALFEERHLDRQVGQMVNADMEMYKIAGAKDMPELKVVLTEVVNGGNNVGLAGLGEAPAVPVAAAIAGAVHNAIGVRVLSLPMTPDKVLTALEAKEKGK